MPLTRLIATVLALGLCTVISTHAEVYKWVDENGKTQFSDKPPADKPAEAIGEALSKTNIDTDSSRVVRTAASAEGEQTPDEAQLEAQQAAERQQRLAPRCKQLRKEIAIIESGRAVSFLDENGNEITVRESERPQKLAEWKAHYAELGCPP